MRVSEADLTLFAAFTLAILEPGQQTRIIEWNGEETSAPDGDSYMPLVSSSFDPKGVRAKRREEFARRLDAAGKLDSSVLLAFHASHGRRPDAYSPCMHRAGAETVSFSWIRVDGAAVEFFYSPEAPCHRGAANPGAELAIKLASCQQEISPQECGLAGKIAGPTNRRLGAER